MSNRLFQTVVHQMKDVVGRTVGIIDESGIVIACSELGKVGESRQRIREELAYASGALAFEGYTYRFVSSAGKNDCVVFVEGTDAHAEGVSKILSVSFGNLKELYDEKYDKVAFIKNIILDNILPSDIYVKSNELRFENEGRRAIMVIKFPVGAESSAYEMVQGYLDAAPGYVININEQDAVLVLDLESSVNTEGLEAQAQELIAFMEKTHGAKPLVGISSIVDTLKDLARAYKEARVALEVGKVFDIERAVMSYDNLGIGRLIYQLPTTLCEIFLQEVFKKGSLESLDRETLMTVQSFFENNLNVSETSRKLFVHRNTLVYRLEKIRKLTGLDLREFDHAVTFKVALMVKKYLTNKQTKF